MSVSGLRWPILLFSIPFAAVLFGIFIVLVAVIYPDDVVVDDYYKDGMAINRRIDQQALAGQLGISLENLAVSGSTLSVHITGADEAGLVLRLFHVTDKSRDRELVLTRQAPAEYSVTAEAVNLLAREGVWYLEIESLERGWKLGDRIHTPVGIVAPDAGVRDE